MSRLVLFAAFALASCVTVVYPDSARPPTDAEGGGPEKPGPPSLTAGPLVADVYADSRNLDGTMSPVVLEEGRDYVVRVSGTYSVWGAYYLGRPCRGEPEPEAQYPSPGRSGPVAMDAAWRFAVPTSSRALCGTPDGSPYPGWQSVRSGWRYRLRAADPWTLAPAFLPYTPDHVYQYHLRGRGEPLRVALIETGEPADNVGRLRFEVFRAEP